MAVRTFVTSGVAFVAAGAVAATVALAPPMSPRDVQVAKSTEVSLNALVTDPALQELINDYFNSGVAAVVQQLLINVVGEDGTASDVINAFFDGGTTQLAYRFLGGDFDGDPSTTPFLSTFFNINNPLGADREPSAVRRHRCVSSRAAGGGAGRSHPSPAVRSDQPLLPGWDPCGNPGSAVDPPGRHAAGAAARQRLLLGRHAPGEPTTCWVATAALQSTLTTRTATWLTRPLPTSARSSASTTTFSTQTAATARDCSGRRGSSSRGCTMAV